MKKIYYFLAFLANDILCQNVFASEKNLAPDFFSMVIRMVSVLAFILAVLLVALYFVKKIDGNKRMFLGTPKCMEIVERLYLGPKKSIALLKIGKEFMLIGLSSNHITFLSKIDISQGLDNDHPKNKPTGFQGFFNDITKKHENEKPFPFSISMGQRVNSVQSIWKRIIHQIVLPHKQNKVVKRRV
jgi:flagellar biosynthetic protein FliO